MIDLAHGKCCSERWISLSSWDCDYMISPQDPNMPVAHSPACLVGKSHSAFKNYFPPIVILGSESFSQGFWVLVFFYVLLFFLIIFIFCAFLGGRSVSCAVLHQNRTFQKVTLWKVRGLPCIPFMPVMVLPLNATEYASIWSACIAVIALGPKRGNPS